MASDPARDKINLSRVLAKIENNDLHIPPHVRVQVRTSKSHNGTRVSQFSQNLQYAKTLAKRVYGSHSYGHAPFRSVHSLGLTLLPRYRNPYEARFDSLENRLDTASIASVSRPLVALRPQPT